MRRRGARSEARTGECLREPKMCTFQGASNGHGAAISTPSRLTDYSKSAIKLTVAAQRRLDEGTSHRAGG